MATVTPAEKSELVVTRIRHPLKMRSVQVSRLRLIAPQMLRVTLHGEDLADFESASFDDHVKVFFPAAGELAPVLPVVGPDGPVFGAGPRPIARDFTPRRFDRAARELDLEFVLHEAGPATQWAAQAAVGQQLGIGGPRGSMIIPVLAWQLLIGDATALPAIARRLEELPPGVHAIVIVQAEDSGARIELSTRAELSVTWCEDLRVGLRELTRLPAGEGFAWAAAESTLVRALRVRLLELGLPKSRIRAAAYWKRGLQAVHENIDD